MLSALHKFAFVRVHGYSSNSVQVETLNGQGKRDVVEIEEIGWDFRRQTKKCTRRP